MSPRNLLRSWLPTAPRTSAARRPHTRLAVEPLEDRATPATLSIGDTTATEGPDAARLLDIPISAPSSPVDIPKSVTRGTDGDYFVTSNSNNQVLRYDGTTFQYEGVFVSAGSGGLTNPIDLVFANGRLIVASADTDSVLQYDAVTGAFLGALVPSGAQGIDRPTDLLVHSGRLYISAWSGDVHRYDLATGLFVDKFVPTGHGGLDDPTGMQFGPDGNFYVAECKPGGPNPVQRFNGTTGQFIDTFIPTGSGGMVRPANIEFGPDGNLYIVDIDTHSVRRYQGDTGAYIGPVIQPGQDGLDQPTRLLFNGNQFLLPSQNNGKVYRYEMTQWAVFTVTLSEPSASPVTVNYATADGTAVAGSDYVATSGTLTFAPGQTTRTILVRTVDDGAAENPEAFTLVLSNPAGATIADGTGVVTITDDDATKFFVVNDAGTDRTYRYGAPGNGLGNSALNAGNTAPRGAASTAAGTTVWVVDANKTVYVYNASGGLLGSWAAGGLHAQAQVEGITVSGADVWLVDNKQDRVYRYAGAATRLSGSQNATSNFALNGTNTSPKDLVTDGTSVWVVNDATADAVFKYTLTGTLLGSWTMAAGGGSPTGITLDPTGASQDLWVVDNATDRVYQYAAARSRTSGSATASATFALAAGNTNPQAIADPPPAAEGVPSATGEPAPSPVVTKPMPTVVGVVPPAAFGAVTVRPPTASPITPAGDAEREAVARWSVRVGAVSKPTATTITPAFAPVAADWPHADGFEDLLTSVTPGQRKSWIKGR